MVSRSAKTTIFEKAFSLTFEIDFTGMPSMVLGTMKVSDSPMKSVISMAS